MSAAKYASLGWGQRYLWLRYHHLPSQARHEAHIVLRLRIPGTITLARIRTALGYLVRRHESLRTTYHVDAGCEPRQRVNSPAALDVVHVTAERDGTPSPAEVVDRLSTAEFDLANEWPIRACVVTRGGVPAQLVLVLNHLAFDVWSITRLEREITALGEALGTGRPVALEPVRHQPSDLVRYEASPAAAGVRERALAFWRDELTTLPESPFPRPSGDGPPAAHSATLTSPAALAAGRRIAARHQVWPYLVHVTAYSMVLAARTGTPDLAHLSFAGNRDSGPYADTMTCMFSPLPLRADGTGEAAFGRLLRRVADGFARGGEHAYLPYDELVEIVARESFRRGRDLRIGSELNFVNEAHLRCRARSTRLAWNPAPAAWALAGTDVYFRIHEWQDAVAVTLNALDSALDAGAVERVLRGYEAVLLAHDEPATDLTIDEVAALTGFRPPAVAPLHRDGRPDATAAEPMPGEAEDALVAAVRRANGLGEVSTADSYVVAGGRVLRAPQVVGLLRDAGWAGVSVYGLAGGRPLRALAQEMTPATGRTG